MAPDCILFPILLIQRRILIFMKLEVQKLLHEFFTICLFFDSSDKVHPNNLAQCFSFLYLKSFWRYKFVFLCCIRPTVYFDCFHRIFLSLLFLAVFGELFFRVLH